MPFLDHELVELAGRIPPEHKLAQGGKGVLKEAARLVIPSEVIDRKKGYFPVPALKYIQGPYLDMVRECGRSGGGFGVTLIIDGSETGSPGPRSGPARIAQLSPPAASRTPLPRMTVRRFISSHPFAHTPRRE